MCPVVARQTMMLVSRLIASSIELLALIMAGAQVCRIASRSIMPMARAQPCRIASCATVPMARINAADHVVRSSDKQMGWKAFLFTGSVALWVVEQQAKSPVGTHVAVRVSLPIGLMACLMA